MSLFTCLWRTFWSPSSRSALVPSSGAFHCPAVHLQRNHTLPWKRNTFEPPSCVWLNRHRVDERHLEWWHDNMKECFGMQGAFRLSKKSRLYRLETKWNSHFPEISNRKKRTNFRGNGKIFPIHPRAKQKMRARYLSTYDILSNQRPCLKFARAGWLMPQV